MTLHKAEDETAIDWALATIKDSIRVALRSRELVAKSAALVERSYALCECTPETNMLKALRTDLKVGLTFASIALQRPNDRPRNQRNARVAYDTVLRQAGRIHMSESDKAEIQSRLEELRTALRQLGEFV